MNISKEVWLGRLLSFIFWIFLAVTIITVVFGIFLPNADEWPGTFPYDDSWSDNGDWGFFAPFLRHLSLLPENFPISKFIDSINGVFLTIFVYKIGLKIKDVLKDGSTEKLELSTYIEWALGAVVSGIIFASSKALSIFSSTNDRVVYVGVIFTFSFVAYFFLFPLRRKLIHEQKNEDSKLNPEMEN